MINDVSALTHNETSLKLAADSNAQIVLMHMQGTPQTMQTAPHYNNVVQDVFDYLQSRIDSCVAVRIPRERLIIDVGIGFGKTPEQNILLLQNIPVFKKLGCLLLIGASRKSFIAHFSAPPLTKKYPAEKRLGGSIAAALYAAQQGADILRVHDVAETRQALLLNAQFQ
jgi:dihydropteroate synthase